MMNADEIRDICRGIRTKKIIVDDDLLTRIEHEVTEYRTRLTQPRPHRPPADIEELLPLMGWLLLEASLAPLWNVATEWDDQQEKSRQAAQLIERSANAARRLPWPHYAARALGAIRSHALVESKRDTERGFDDAWILHEEARKKHASFLDSHGPQGAERYLRDLDEMLLQLALAETGTACRTAERVIGRWAEGKRTGDWTEADGVRWTQQMFRRLSDAVDLGEQALNTAETIEHRWSFTAEVDEHRLAMATSYRLPAVMTARAVLLMYTLTPALENLGVPPTGGYASWADARDGFLKRFHHVYSYIERPVRRPDGAEWPLLLDHQRSVAQIRLHLAIVRPGAAISSELGFDPCVLRGTLDERAVEALSEWLARFDEKRGKPNGDANVIGCATKPDFIQAVEVLRREAGLADGYRAWRQKWAELDRYCAEPGRAELVRQAFEEAGPETAKPS